MPMWQLGLLCGVGCGCLWFLHQIFLEVRSIRRMMNEDRRISNEVQSFDDDIND